MKIKLNDFFDKASAEELDTILGDSFTDEPADPVMLKRLEKKVLGKKKSRKPVFKRVTSAVAACLAVAVCAGAGGYALKAEAAEYKAAADFFEEYNLSAEGLTRSEVKKVYRDISSQSFSYSATAEVIKNSVYEGDIEGYAISAETPTPENIAEFWNSRVDYSEIDGERAELIVPDELGEAPFEFAVFSGEEELWRIDLGTDYLLRKWAKLDDRYVVFGRGLGVWDSVVFACISADGQLQFVKNINLVEDDDPMDFAVETIEAVFSNEEGGITILGSALDSATDGGFGKCLYIINTDSSGNVISTNTADVGWLAITGVTQTQDGYLLQVADDTDDRNNTILKIDREGNPVVSIGLGEDKYIHNITDMAEVNGKLYISSYVTAEDDSFTLRKNLTSAYGYEDMMDNSDIDISEEELLLAVKESYTAMLLICDIEEGNVQNFYSVDGAVGARLTVSDAGDVIWDVKNIIEAEVKHYYEIYTLNTRCSVSRYLIANGEVSGIEDTSKYSTHKNQYYHQYTNEELIEHIKDIFGEVEGMD